ncbi:MAG: DUF2225 domain-containing protein, partial [Methanocorpusculum sp.]|nr:DUF2225 domain-containing protein [Methanocorpusculum sp.]
MTTFEEIEVTCAVCGTKSKHRVLTSTCSFGSQDLDTRPAPLERYTLELKIMECPNCHYASDDIGEATPDIISYLKSEDYVSVNENSAKTGMNSLAASYFKSALIKFEAEKNSDSALIKFLSAAWACDDRGDKVNADEFRLYASNILLSFSDELSLNEDMCACLLADIYRRRGNFDNAMKVCRENESDDDTIKK